MIRQIEKSLTIEFWSHMSSNKFRWTKLLVGTIVIETFCSVVDTFYIYKYSEIYSYVVTLTWDDKLFRDRLFIYKFVNKQTVAKQLVVPGQCHYITIYFRIFIYVESVNNWAESFNNYSPYQQFCSTKFIWWHMASKFYS